MKPVSMGKSRKVKHWWRKLWENPERWNIDGGSFGETPKSETSTREALGKSRKQEYRCGKHRGNPERQNIAEEDFGEIPHKKRTVGMYEKK